MSRKPRSDSKLLRACLKNGFASDAPSSVSLARREERAYWNISVSEEQRSQADDRQADEANALFKQALSLPEVDKSKLREIFLKEREISLKDRAVAVQEGRYAIQNLDDPR